MLTDNDQRREAADHSEPFEVGSHAHQTLELRESGSLKAIAQSKRQAFLAISDRAGAPEPVPQLHSEEAGVKLRAACAEHGGVPEMVSAYYSGRDPGPLFAPFGPNLSAAEEQAAADMFASYPRYADDLWTSALQIATRYRKKRT